MKLQKNTQFWLISIISAITAGVMSLWIGMKQSVWFDEAYTIMVAKQPVEEAVRLAAVDTHPPLFYLLLHYWGDVFQWDILMLRLLSIIFYVGSTLVGVALVKKLFGRRVALYALGAMVLAPLMMRYGFEIRMYSFAAFIGITATYCMVMGLSESSKKKYAYWVAYAALVVIGVYALYYLVLLWLSHLVWLLWMTAKKRKLTKLHRQPWVYAYIASVVPFLPWLPTFLKQMNNGALAPIGQVMNLENIIGVFTFNAVYQPIWQLDIPKTFLIISAAGAVVYIARMAFRHLRKTERSSLLLISLYILGPIVILMLLSLSRPMYVERYLSHVAIGFMLLLGVLAGLAARKQSRGTLLATGILAVTLVSGLLQLNTSGNYNFQRMAKPEVAAISKNITTCKNTTVIAADPYVAIELAVYIDTSCMKFYSEWDSLGGGYAPLDKSPLQFKTLMVPATTKNIVYVYYDDPKLTIPSEYKKVSGEKRENLSVVKYRN